MPMFVWSSSALRQYGLGTIAICADNREAAIEKALVDWKKWSRERWDYMIYLDDTEWIDQKDKEFEGDLRALCRITDSLFVIGSD